jgi:autotransporter translocation and assembly factor TamB
VQQLCWVSGGARLCGDLDWRSGQQMQLAATVTELPLKMIEPFLPADVELVGTISGDARLHTAGGGVLLGNAVLRPSAGASLWNASRGEQTRVALEGGELRLTADAAGVTTRADLRLSNGGTLQGSVMLPGFRMGRPAAAQPLQGSITASFGDLRFVQALVPVLAAPPSPARTPRCRCSACSCSRSSSPPAATAPGRWR